MNIVANNIASKLFVAFVAVAMLFMLVSPAKAATTDELQAQITALLAQIASLQGQVGQGGQSVASGVCPFTWTRSLNSGATGADVMKLQQFLNADVDTRVSASGVGSVGMETEYYGPATAAAVSKFQVKYRSDVLSPGGLVNPTGMFGPASMAKANMICASAPAGDDTSDDSADDSSDDSDDDMSSSDLSGEADLTTMEVSDGDDSDDVEEGSEDVEVAEFAYEFSDGDAMITRIDLALYVDGGNNGDDDAWDVFQDVSLWIDGDEVARKDVTDEDDFLDEDNGSIRFSGLDIVGMEDEEVTIVVAVSVNNSVDGVASGDTEDWNIAAGPIRFVDADDVTSTETFGDAQAMDGSYAGTVAEFSIEEAGAGDDLNLEDSDEDPVATTFELDEDKNVEEMIFAFDLSADDSDGDVDLNTLTLTATATGVTNMDDLVNDFRLEIDGQSFAAESYVGTALTATIVFDIDGDVTIDAEDTVTALLYADFEDMEDADQGATLVVGIEAEDVDAEGVEDITVDGSAVESNVHTYRTGGVAVEYSSDTVTADENNDTITTDNAADYTLKFTVESFGSDSVYLPFGANASTTILTDGVGYSIVDTNTNAIVTTGTSTPGLTAAGGSTVTKTNSFKVGSTPVTFTLTVNHDAATSGSYKLRLDSIMFAASDVATATTIQDVSDLDIETDPITISN